MALYDDRAWLLSHISHSFVLSDESGVSEACLNRQQGRYEPCYEVRSNSTVTSSSRAKRRFF